MIRDLARRALRNTAGNRGRAVFPHDIDFSLRGFPPWTQYGRFAFRSVTTAAADTQFDAFATRVIAATGKSYLPIYRMADGEFSLLLGYRRPRGVGRSLRARAKGVLVEGASRLRLRGFGTMWGERFSRAEILRARDRLAELLPALCNDGVVAAYFMHREDRWGDEYVEPMLRWFEQHGIALTERNYVPFYFVYALLNGPRRHELFGGRHVLVATFAESRRNEAIRKGLIATGAREVSFLPISRSRAMFDQVHHAGDDKPDIALVAGGIGAINIIAQLANLSIPAIDCGITIECFIEPNRRRERPFLSTDV
ncbi:MAG: hypothetical protein ACAI38_22095 [Myxococcota bacterium]